MLLKFVYLLFIGISADLKPEGNFMGELGQSKTYRNVIENRSNVSSNFKDGKLLNKFV